MVQESKGVINTKASMVSVAKFGDPVWPGVSLKRLPAIGEKFPNLSP